MATTTEPEFILYDLACTKDVCFSPAVWRVRLLLNYKGISYKTVFLEIPDIEPTLKGLGVQPVEDGKIKYTVPTIYHVPTDKYVMDSVVITQFIHDLHPDPPFVLSSDLGNEIEMRSRGAIGKAFRVSIAPRELQILASRSQEYFRQTREAELGHPLEDLLKHEDKIWASAADEQEAVSALLKTNSKDGPFVLGNVPSITDFFIIGALQSAKVVDSEVWDRVVKYDGFLNLYKACIGWMEQNR